MMRVIMLLNAAGVCAGKRPKATSGAALPFQFASGLSNPTVRLLPLGVESTGTRDLTGGIWLGRATAWVYTL